MPHFQRNQNQHSSKPSPWLSALPLWPFLMQKATASPQLRPLLASPTGKAANISPAAVGASVSSPYSLGGPCPSRTATTGPPISEQPRRVSSAILGITPGTFRTFMDGPPGVTTWNFQAPQLSIPAHPGPYISVLTGVSSVSWPAPPIAGLHPAGLQGLYLPSFKTQERAQSQLQRHQWFNGRGSLPV